MIRQWELNLTICDPFGHEFSKISIYLYPVFCLKCFVGPPGFQCVTLIEFAAVNLPLLFCLIVRVTTYFQCLFFMKSTFHNDYYLKVWVTLLILAVLLFSLQLTGIRFECTFDVQLKRRFWSGCLLYFVLFFSFFIKSLKIVLHVLVTLSISIMYIVKL